MGVSLTDIRCSRCNAKLAEALDGKVVIKCRRCDTVNVLTAVVKVETQTVTT